MYYNTSFFRNEEYLFIRSSLETTFSWSDHPRNLGNKVGINTGWDVNHSQFSAGNPASKTREPEQQMHIKMWRTYKNPPSNPSSGPWSFEAASLQILPEERLMCSKCSWWLKSSWWEATVIRTHLGWRRLVSVRLIRGLSELESGGRMQ